MMMRLVEAVEQVVHIANTGCQGCVLDVGD
jgi:hypothetical protein